MEVYPVIQQGLKESSEKEERSRTLSTVIPDWHDQALLGRLHPWETSGPRRGPQKEAGSWAPFDDPDFHSVKVRGEL